MNTFFENEIDTIAEFFSRPSNDKTCLLVGEKPFQEGEKIYFNLLGFSSYLSAKSCAKAFINRVIDEFMDRGAIESIMRLSPPGLPSIKIKVKVLIVNKSEVPPTADWRPIHQIEVFTPETEGVREWVFVNDPVRRKVEFLIARYGPDYKKMKLKPNDRRYSVTDEDYKKIRTSKVLILNQALSREPAPPPTSEVEPFAGREPDYAAYADALLNGCDDGESVIYPIFAGKTVPHQQALLSQAVGRAAPGTRLKTERYGSRYLRLRLKWRI